MKKIYKVILIILLILLLLFILVGSGYYLYKKNIAKNSAEVLVSEELSINYMTGNSVSFKSKNKTIDFSVINDSENDIMYHIILENIKLSDSKITCKLYENNKLIIDNMEISNEKAFTLSSFASIKALETKSYKLVIENNKKAEINFEINVQKASVEDPNFSQLILNNNTIKKEPTTKVGEEIATNDEGLIMDVDDNGNTFYFRGNVVNNYVKFANKIWRIVRINGNGTIKLILDDNVGNSNIYGNELTKDRSETLKRYSKTNISSLLENWYETNLRDYDDYIADSKFCIDMSREGENFSNYFRINISNIPTFNCLGTKNTSKIGILTADEIIYAGATINETNNYFYLYRNTDQNPWWTLSAVKDSLEGLYFYEISGEGKINFSSTGESTKAIRPVINLKKDLQMVGTGTVNDPYHLK